MSKFKRYLRNSSFLPNLLSFIIIPVQVILFLPALLLAFLNVPVSFLFQSNGFLIGFFHKFLRGKRLIWQNKNISEKNDVVIDTNIFKTDHGSFLGKYNQYFSIVENSINPKRAFIVSIKSEAKRKFMNLVRKEGSNLISKYGSFENTLLSLDKKLGLNLYQNILIDKGNYPNFIKTDTQVWEFLVEHHIDYAMEKAGGVDEFFSQYKNAPFDQPGNFETFGRENRFERDYIGFMSTNTNPLIKIQYQLTRHKQIEGSWGSMKVADNYGDWIYLLSKHARFYLFSSLENLRVISEVSHTSGLEIHIRQIFYGIIQAADSELSYRVSQPFRNYLINNNIKIHISEKLEEFSKFLNGSFPPTMAGVAKFLNFVKKKNDKEDDILIKNFEKFVETSEYLDLDLLLNRKFIQKLFQIGRLRGTIMHPSDIDFEECMSVLNYLLEEEMPGKYFYAIGIDRGY